MKALAFKWNPTTAPANLRAVFDSCVRVLNSPHGTSGVALVLKGSKPARQTSRYLAGRSSPKGEIVSDTDGGQIVSFQAIEVLSWMTAHQFCTAEISDGDARLRTGPSDVDPPAQLRPTVGDDAAAGGDGDGGVETGR